MKNSISIPLTLAVTAGLLTGGRSPGAKPGPGGAAPVLVATAFTTNVPVQIQPPPVGHVAPYSTVTVHSQIGGILEQVHFKEGSEAKSNALLFTIDPRPMQATLARDQAQLENAAAQFNRDQKLLAAKIESPDQFDIS